MPVIRRPPRLAVGHQRRQVVLERLVIECVERFGVIEIVAHRVGRQAALVEDVERQRFGPPVLVLTAEQGADRAWAVYRATHRFAGLRIHNPALQM
jgi:hypothetical protein